MKKRKVREGEKKGKWGGINEGKWRELRNLGFFYFKMDGEE